MPQWLSLDRPGWRAYLPLVLLAGCRPSVEPAIPPQAASATIEQVREWVGATLPAGRFSRPFRWLFQDDRSSAGGAGRARVAGPDTLRFDATGPLGSGRFAALVIGAEAQWAVPEEQVAQIVPDYALLWAMFGAARMPNPSASLRGIEDDDAIVWAYSLGADTLVYTRRKGSFPRFIAEVRRGGKLFGRVETRLSQDGHPVRARLVVPEAPAQLDIEFGPATSESVFPPEIWNPPDW